MNFTTDSNGFFQTTLNTENTIIVGVKVNSDISTFIDIYRNSQTNKWNIKFSEWNNTPIANTEIGIDVFYYSF